MNTTQRYLVNGNSKTTKKQITQDYLSYFARLEENVPDKIKTINRWIFWKFVHIDGKLKKRPVNETGVFISCNDPLEWKSFHEVKSQFNPQRHNGVGFVFANDGIVGIDIDDVFDQNGNIAVMNHDRRLLIDEIFARFDDTYVEKSPSGSGVHILCQAVVPEGTKNRSSVGVELYTSNQFFTFTGRCCSKEKILANKQNDVNWLIKEAKLYRDLDDDIDISEEVIDQNLDEDSIIEILKSNRAYDCFFVSQDEVKKKYSSLSEADLAICSIVASLTHDRKTIESIWRNTVLNRDKLDRQDYVDRTIAKALESAITKRDVMFFTEKLNRFQYSIIASMIRQKYENYILFEEIGLYRWNGKIWELKEKNYEYVQSTLNLMIQTYLNSVIFKLFSLTCVTKDDMASVQTYKANLFKLQSFLLKPSYINQVQKQLVLKMKITLEQINKNVLVFNNGTLNLETLEFSPQFDKSHYATSMFHFDYDSHARHPLWSTMLNNWTQNDHELRNYLQYMSGYFLMKGNPARKLFILYGPTSTGKTTFQTILKSVLGQYAIEGNHKILYESPNSSNALYEKATYVGKRLVCLSELSEHDSFGATMKELTGNNDVRARIMYQLPFQYKPDFKFLVATNKLPSFSSEDDAIRKRIVIIPFDKVIERDKHVTLSDVLEDHTFCATVFNWLFEGYRRLKVDGLNLIENLPTVSIQELDEYDNENDLMKQFVTYYCIVDNSDNSFVCVEEMVTVFNAWMRKSRSSKYSYKSVTIGKMLKRLGVTSAPKKVNGITLRVYCGIRFRPRVKDEFGYHVGHFYSTFAMNTDSSFSQI